MMMAIVITITDMQRVKVQTTPLYSKILGHTKNLYKTSSIATDHI